MALATSGSYKNYVLHQGQHYSHTFSPKTFAPIENKNIQVSVILRSCALADGWATALMAMKSEKALMMAERYDIPMMLITIDEKTKRPKKIHSRAWKLFASNK